MKDFLDVVELFLLDCSGKELYMESLGDIMKEADLIVAVYDVTKTETFGNVAKASIPLKYILLHITLK